MGYPETGKWKWGLKKWLDVEDKIVYEKILRSRNKVQPNARRQYCALFRGITQKMAQ
jgi:hypothetical protein